jgi:hypothetical protein
MIADMKKDKENTSRDLLDMSISFDNLAASYTTNFTIIKQTQAVLEPVGRGADPDLLPGALGVKGESDGIV